MTKPKHAIICGKLATQNESKTRENKEDSQDTLHPANCDSDISLPEDFLRSIPTSGYGSTIIHDTKQEDEETFSGLHEVNKESLNKKHTSKNFLEDDQKR